MTLSVLMCCPVFHVFPPDDFKKMYMQKFKEMEKAYNKQVKSIKQMKSRGVSKVHAVSPARHNHSNIQFFCKCSF